MLAAKVESVRLFVSPLWAALWMWLPLQKLISLALVNVSSQCHKLLQIQWLKIRSIILTVMGSEIYSGLCFMAL